MFQLSHLKERRVARARLQRTCRRPVSRSKAVVGIAAVAVLFASAGCGAGSNSNGDAYQIGIIKAETGPLAGAGKAFLNGALSAQDVINKNGMLGESKKIDLVEKESAEDPARSASVASQLASDPKILGTICCVLSPVAGAVKPIMKAKKMPTILYGATEIGLEEPPYIIRTTTMPQPANEALAKAIAEKTDIKTVAYNPMTDNEGMVSQKDAFKTGFDAAGVNDLGQVGTLSGQKDFNSAATKLMQMKPDAIVVAATQAENVGMIVALHDRGYMGQIVTGETVVGDGVFDSNPDALANVPFPGYFLPTETTPAGEEFTAAYKKRTGSLPNNFAAQGFNAVFIMATALKKAGSDPSRASLTKALDGLESVDGTVYGTVTFEGGQMSAGAGVKIVNYTKPDGAIVPFTGF